MLPKSAFTAHPLSYDAALLELPGVMGPLTRYMEVEAGLEHLLEWLAGDLVLVKDLDSARALAAKLPAGAKAVTLEGWMVSAEGAISGGANEAAERGLLSRDREMSALKAGIERGEAQVQSMEADRERLRGELGDLSRQIEEGSRAKSDAEIAVAKLQKEQGARQDDVGRLAKESEDKRKAIEVVQVEAAGFRGRHETLDRRLVEMAGQETDLQAELNALLDEIDRLRKDEEARVETVNQQRVAQAGADQRLQNLRITLSRFEQEAKGAGEQALRREDEAAQSQREQEELRQKNGGLETQLKTLFERKTQAQDKVRLCAEARGSRQEAIGHNEEEVRRVRQEAAGISEQRHSQEMQGTELKLKLEALEQTLSKDYHVDVQALDQDQLFVNVEGKDGAEPLPEPSPERADELTRKLEELGVVNPAAADEYRELEQRHSLLVGQLEDLRSAKADLMKVITKINQESRERFLATFEKVHEAFKRTYRILFGGGEAKLILQEEGDLLEAGIDIIARPPGKRQQTISLLSGGEKALTATALLFALFETKPSPFCVLDEIDAPLDDANISRFSGLLTEYAKNTQFIVITHSKLTMEKADVLYGVTMEEAGVSRIISAKFKDEKAVTV